MKKLSKFYDKNSTLSCDIGKMYIVGIFRTKFVSPKNHGTFMQ